LTAERIGGQWLISGVAGGSGVVQTAENDHRADTAGKSAIYKICRRKAHP